MKHLEERRQVPESAADQDSPIVRPKAPKRAPEGGPVGVMVGSLSDLSALLNGMEVDPDSAFPLFLSRLYGVRDLGPGVYLVGPLVGAPYAAMILETLIAMGVHRVLFYGWCGAVSRAVHIGDVVLPTEAVIDEGTSGHYLYEEKTGEHFSKKVHPSRAVQDVLRKEMTRRGFSFQEGPIWTTDAVFRETKEKTARHQAEGVLAVDMEASALFSVGRFHGAQVGSLLVVSDEIASFTWKPGFRTEPFRSARHRTGEVIQSVCQRL